MARHYTAIPGHRVGIPLANPGGTSGQLRLSGAALRIPGAGHRTAFVVGSTDRRDDVLKLAVRLLLAQRGFADEDILMYLGIDNENLSREAQEAMERYEKRPTPDDIHKGSNSRGNGRKRAVPRNRKSTASDAKEDASGQQAS